MWIVNIGAIFALCTSLLGAMFPLPRVLYAMASDGVIFKFLAKVHPKTQTPIIGTFVAGSLTGEEKNHVPSRLLFNIEKNLYTAAKMFNLEFSYFFNVLMSRKFSFFQLP